MKVVFGTVVYKESFKYYQEFAESINNQDNNDFDIVLLNDNLSNEEIQKVLNSLQKNAIVWNGKPNSTPSSLRVELIKNAKENGYDLLIMGDFDDMFSQNRVSKIMSEYEETFSFYYNDLYYFDKQRKFFNNLPQYTNEISDIIEHNYLGLSNTAMNLKAIDLELIDKLNVRDASVFDWYMYTILLNERHKGKKVENCKTYYRIYGNNIAGESNNTIANIKKEIGAKIKHYSLLRDFDAKFNELLHYYKELETKFDKGEIDIFKYVDSDNDYWWGQIKLEGNKIKEIIK